MARVSPGPTGSYAWKQLPRACFSRKAAVSPASTGTAGCRPKQEPGTDYSDSPAASRACAWSQKTLTRESLPSFSS